MPARTSSRAISNASPRCREVGGIRIILTVSPLEFDRPDGAARTCTRCPARFFNSDAIDIKILHRRVDHIAKNRRPELAGSGAKNDRSSNQLDLGVELDGFPGWRRGHDSDEIAFGKLLVQHEHEAMGP